MHSCSLFCTNGTSSKLQRDCETIHLFLGTTISHKEFPANTWIIHNQKQSNPIVCSLCFLSLSVWKAIGWEYSITHPPLTVNTHTGSHHPAHVHSPRDDFIRTDQPPWHRMVAHPPHWIIQAAGGAYQQFGAVGGGGSMLLMRTTEPYRFRRSFIENIYK